MKVKRAVKELILERLQSQKANDTLIDHLIIPSSGNKQDSDHVKIVGIVNLKEIADSVTDLIFDKYVQGMKQSEKNAITEEI